MTNDRFAVIVSDIEKASDGASLRQALLNALKAMNEDGGNALTFGGYTPSYFAHKDEFDRYMRDMGLLLDQFDENPDEGSVLLVHSGNVYNYIKALWDRLNTINGRSAYRDINECVLADVVTALSKTKRLIKEAIEYQQGTIEEDDTFEDYAERIKDLQVWNNIGEITITENGVKKASDYEDIDGWNVVNIDVKPKVEAKLIKTVGTHTVPAGIDAWDPVTIDVPGLKSKTSASGGSGRGGSGGSGSGSSDYIKEYAHLDIKANGTYNASEQQKEAISSVDVQVNGIDPAVLALRTFTVTFQDDTGETLEEIQNVKGGTNVIYGQTYYERNEVPPKLKKVSEDGTIYTFSHWNPPPYYIDHDMTCTAWYEKGTISFNEALYDWKDVVTGSNVSVGDIKVLNLLPYKNGDNTVYFGSVRMRCVSTKEAWSTWLSEDLIPYSGYYGISTANNSDPKRISIAPVSGYYVSEEGPGKGTTIEDHSDPAYSAANKLGWANSPLRVWLNTDFLNNCIPPLIRQRIVGVDKTNHNIYGYNPDDHTVTDAVADAGDNLPNVYGRSSVYDGTLALDPAASKVWIPSVRELWGSYSKQFPDIAVIDREGASDNRTFCVERDGINYISNSTYIEPVDINWSDSSSRKDALRQVFLDKQSEGSVLSNFTIKQIGYTPYNELIASNRPFSEVISMNTPFNWRLAAYPMRTFYDGAPMMYSEWGNPKKDQSMAANEEINSVSQSSINLAQYGIYSPYSTGICFGFCIG